MTKSYVYLGDIGDNVARMGFGLGRSEVRVHRVEEPQLPSTRGARQRLSSVETLRFVYPDHAHDAEALFVDPLSGDLFISVEQGRRRQLARLPSAGAPGRDRAAHARGRGEPRLRALVCSRATRW